MKDKEKLKESYRLLNEWYVEQPFIFQAVCSVSIALLLMLPIFLLINKLL